ncbi:MAG: DNA-processing protein DprA [Clostridia bacterium]|nr:DNA-processing protein DprA [Clostridia bacterium]
MAKRKDRDGEDRLLAWLWLAGACRPGSVLPSTLLKFFGSPEKIYEAGEEDFDQVDTNFYGHKDALCDKELERARSVLAYCRENGIGVMTPDDYLYPEKLRAIPNKPMVLYYLGNFFDPDTTFTVGVVGTRRASNYGIHAAKRIAYDLARSGGVICSGMASGIDAAAHRAALYCDKFTVGVLGCGIDRVYPKENEALYKDVIEKGLLLTEYPPGTAPLGRNFPVRNRLISALSDAVVVVEGSETSGALITAEDAMQQGKALYAVPGSIFAADSAGSNFLLKLGAKPLLSAYDIVTDFQKKYPGLEGAVKLFRQEDKERREQDKPKKKPGVRAKIKKYAFPGLRRASEDKEPVPPAYEFIPIGDAAPREGEDGGETAAPATLPQLSDEEIAVYGRLSFEPAVPDQLLSEGQRMADLLTVLTKLEIKGLIDRAPGGKYVRRDRAEV